MAASNSGLAEAIAEVARAMQSADTARGALQKMVDLAPVTVPGCAHAGVSLVVADRFVTPVASDGVPETVDRIQYETGQGPCLSAIREQEVFHADDLREDARWPAFSARAAAETGVRSMLSFRLYLREDTMGSLNLYSRTPYAFAADSKRVGAVFASHAAVAFAAAREHDRAQELQHDLHSSQRAGRRSSRQAEIAIALQRSMLTDLPDTGPLQLAARYLPSVTEAEVGGDWYDAFTLADGATALIIGDVEGHDLDAAIFMGQVRNVLRSLALDRQDTPHGLLHRLDCVLRQLGSTKTVTCIYARIDGGTGAPWQLRIANAGHPPPLLVPAHGAARYLHGPPEPLLGATRYPARQTLTITLPLGSTLLLFTDGLVERRGRDIDDGLARLHETATDYRDEPLEQLCDHLLSRLAAHPTDDVCLLALRTPPAVSDQPPHWAGSSRRSQRG